MKSLFCNMCVISVIFFTTCAAGWPANWPVTNAVHYWEIYDGTHDLRTVVALSLLRTPRDYRLPRPSENLIKYAENNRIPISDMVGEAQTIAKEGFAILESGSITNKEEITAVLRYCETLIGFMGTTKDPSAIPYLEIQSTSAYDDIRRTASNRIINILGAKSIEFLRKVTNDKLYKRDLYSLYESFGFKIKMEIKNNPNAKLNDAYNFLLEVSETEEAGDTAKMIDQILCETLNGYSTSVQREKMAERMVRVGPDYSRHHFETIQLEVKKTPKEKRKDFSAKGELLDPERRKNKTDIQP